MVRNFSRRLLGFGFALLAGAGAMNDVAAEAGELKRVACFGRFMIDLPTGAEVAGQRSEFMFGTMTAEQANLGTDAFAERMEQRERMIKASGLGRVYHWTRTIAPTPDARVFVGSRDAFGDTAYAFEAYALTEGGALFSMSKTAYSPEKIDSVLSRLQKNIIAALRARDPAEIPTEPGLCIEHGFIASDGSERASERFEISLDFERWPDMMLTIGSSTIHKAEPSLLERVGNAEVPAAFQPLLRHIRTVRKGRHDVGAITGEALLQMFPSDAGHMTHTFHWESHFALNDPFKPALVVELTTGRLSKWQDKRPTISEQEAVALFDAVVNSIRLRPTTPAKPAIEPKAALGTPLVTGRSCPQSGVWQADEGERRFVREGETMPATRVVVTPSFLARLRGGQPLARRATRWTLVAYEPDPPSGAEPPSGEPTAT
jgi:hypothetical protein